MVCLASHPYPLVTEPLPWSHVAVMVMVKTTCVLHWTNHPLWHPFAWFVVLMGGMSESTFVVDHKIDGMGKPLILIHSCTLTHMHDDLTQSLFYTDGDTWQQICYQTYSLFNYQVPPPSLLPLDSSPKINPSKSPSNKCCLCYNTLENLGLHPNFRAYFDFSYCRRKY